MERRNVQHLHSLELRLAGVYTFCVCREYLVNEKSGIAAERNVRQIFVLAGVALETAEKQKTPDMAQAELPERCQGLRLALTRCKCT